MEKSEYSVLKIYASSTDKIGMKLLYEYIVELAKEQGLAGATVYRGMMGFGQSSNKISSSRFWELTEKLPVMIELMDKTAVLDAFFSAIEPGLQGMQKGCLVSMEPVQILLMKPGKRS
jgi:PII-like signaling protein